MSSDFDRYKEFVQRIQYRELPVSHMTSRQIKWQELKVTSRKKWIQAQAGAKFGFIAGGALGLIMGTPMAFKSRSITPMLMTGLFSGLFFASISSVGTLLHN